MNRTFVWSMVGLVLLSGCVPSLNAVYTPHDVIFKPEVLGVWQQAGSSEKWEFLRGGAKSYRLVHTDRAGHSGRFIAHLADIEGTLMLDLCPENIEDGTSGFYRFHQAPIHSIYLVKKTGDEVVIAAIDHAWLEEYLQEHPDTLSSAKFGPRRIVTAETEQLQRVLVDNKDRFVHEITLTRTPVGAVR